MGTWGTGLYDNDTTCDVKDTYIELSRECDINSAFKQTKLDYAELFGSDEEAFFWYALAETQWTYAELMPEVKQRALEWINLMGGITFFDQERDQKLWLNTLKRIKGKMESPYPKRPKKHMPKIEYVTNPWKVGDLYAYKFHTIRAKEVDVSGKYMLFQKIGNMEYCDNIILSVIQVYDKIFDDFPNLEDVQGVRVLPLVVPLDGSGTEFQKREYTPSFQYYLKAYMIPINSKSYPKKHFAYIGNVQMKEDHYAGNKLTYHYWSSNTMEDWLLEYYFSWRHVKY